MPSVYRDEGGVGSSISAGPLFTCASRSRLPEADGPHMLISIASYRRDGFLGAGLIFRLLFVAGGCTLLVSAKGSEVLSCG